MLYFNTKSKKAPKKGVEYIYKKTKKLKANSVVLSKLIVEDIVKKYKNGIIALRGVSFKVNEGEICSIIGPNGAGKTTLIKIIAGLILPDEGKILYYNGHCTFSIPDDGNIKKLIGFLPSSERSFYYRLTGRQNLEFFAMLMDIPASERVERINKSLEIVNFPQKVINNMYMTYSKGERQKLGLARALLNDPKIILLDEPTTGLDVVSSREIRGVILSLKKGRIFVLCSHDLREVEEISDKVVILHEGRIIKKGAPTLVKKLFPDSLKKNVKIIFVDREAFYKNMQLVKSIKNAVINEEKGEITLPLEQSYNNGIRELIFSILHTPECISSFKIEEISLEELFIKIFGKANENTS